MTNRERLLAVLDGRSPDRIPWIPRLRIWHTAHARRGDLPARWHDVPLEEIERELGMGTPARDGHVYRARQAGDVETSSVAEGESVVTTYDTPAGSVSTRHQRSAELTEAGIGSLEVEHVIKTAADFEPVEYLYRNMTYEETYEDFLAYDSRIGDDGLPMVSAGDCPFHFFLQKLAGYQNGYYLLADHPDKVERLLRTLEEIDRERVWPLIAASPARLILHGLHFDSSITPPHLFDRYITPYYRDLADLLHANGKALAMHADNDSRLILNHIERAGYDMAETFTTAPQVSCTLEEARAAWDSRVIIWGGLPSVLLEPTYSSHSFESYMRQLFRTIAPGDAFILGVADNVMPAAMLERLERVGAMIADWGSCPIDPAMVPAP